MATRQYIGARYVPKFADPIAWESGKSYEALTIVTYLNNSYTSKKPVPATVGNPVDNTDYWVVTGNYNGQVEQYRQEVEQNSQEVKQYSQETERYIAEVEHLKNPDFVIIGDSYSTLDYITRDDVWWSKIAKQMMLIPHCFAVSGSGYVTKAGDTFIEQLNRAATDNSFDNSNVKYVLVFGGLNDGNSDISGAIDTLCNAAKMNFTNAAIILIGVNTWVNNLEFNDGTTSATVQRNICNAAYRNGVAFIPMFDVLVGESTMIDNNTEHPNKIGHNNMAARVLCGINGTVPISKVKTFNISSATAGAVSGVKMLMTPYDVRLTGSFIPVNGENVVKLSFPNNLRKLIPVTGVNAFDPLGHTAYMYNAEEFAFTAEVYGAENRPYFINNVSFPL